MMNPALVPFMAALVSDRMFKTAIEKAVTVYAHGWAEHHDYPDWPGVDDVVDAFLKKFMENALVHDVVGRSPHLKTLFTPDVRGLLWKDPDVLKRAIIHTFPEREAERLYNEQVEERASEIADDAALAKDPYAYYGLSRRDFMACSSLKHAVLRLAHTNPELRKHLVPLLRGGRY